MQWIDNKILNTNISLKYLMNLKKILGRKSTGKGRSGSKRGVKIPELALAVLKYELETLASLQDRYQGRLCLPGRAYQFALVHYPHCSRAGVLSTSTRNQLTPALKRR